MGPVPFTLTLSEVEDRLYCKRCWKNYGWYIKRGPPYNLSLNVDRLARKHGVQIVEVNIGKGKAKGKGLQPFECCNQRFNHKRLASHLQSHEAAESKTEMDTQTDLIWVEDNLEPDVCWEFEVKDGTWQAFLPEVQDELEGHYALLHPLLDLGGPNQVTITTNGFTYEINFKDMTQKNVKTNRVRLIRRGQQPNQMIFLSMLGEKDALIDELREKNEAFCEMYDHVRQKNDALAKQVEELQGLRAENQRLKQSNHLDHDQKMRLVECWRMEQQLSQPIRQSIRESDPVYIKVKEMLAAACPPSHFDPCALMRCNSLEIVSVEQVHNVLLWNKYTARKDRMRKELANAVIARCEGGILELPWIKLEEGLNEFLLLHGTHSDKIDIITQFGFDERIAREGGLYGRGVYFTDESCKSLQYSGAVDGGIVTGEAGHIIVTRVLVGQPHFAQGPMKSTKFEPYIDESDPSKGRCNSVLVQPGTVRGSSQQQVHREFVIFDNAQTYPELVISFRVH